MQRIVFATCAAYPNGIEDDQLAAELVGAGFRVWDDESVDWHAYDRVIVRSTWDYTSKIDDFLAWADSVGAERLRNPPALIRFNADKRYLAKLQAPTVPTTLLEPGDQLAPYDGEIVIKPNISAGGRDTGRFQPSAADEARGLVEMIHATGRVALIQPYLPGVDVEGERAVVFFAGQISHVLHKRAVPARALHRLPTIDMAPPPSCSIRIWSCPGARAQSNFSWPSGCTPSCRTCSASRCTRASTSFRDRMVPLC